MVASADGRGSRYAFPPLLKSVIAEDIGLTDSEVLTSNIIALLATLLVRLVAGTCCDRFGARWTFAGCLLIGAIPTFLAGTAHNFSELCALRFFVGILGGSFVPCQVWTTACKSQYLITGIRHADTEQSSTRMLSVQQTP